MKEYRLCCHERIRLDEGAPGMTVCCREGVLWITRTGTPGDHLLRAGGVFSSDRPGRIVIGALADSAFSVAEGKAAPALTAGVLLQALRRMIRRTAEAGRCLRA